MALSFKSVEKAYEVFHEIKEKQLPELEIHSFPEDTSVWLPKTFQDAIPNRVYGYIRKSDDGWENIFFWTPEPSTELLELFNRLKGKVPNSSISKLDDNGMWCFGWF